MAVFANVETGAAFLGISIKQFRRATELAEVNPAEFCSGRVQKYIWTFAQLEQNRDKIMGFVNKHMDYNKGASLPGNRRYSTK